MKKVFALVLALCMVLTIGAAFADEPTHPAWSGAVDTSISVKGLTEGDSVKFYRVLAYDDKAYGAVADATDPTVGAASWKAVAPFAGMTLADFKAILTTGISAEIAGRLGAMATGTPTYDPITVGSSGIATVNSPAAGLYIAMITPAAGTNNTYNPVFVGADYYANTDANHKNEWTVTADMSYSDSAMAKVSTVTLEKTGTDSNTVDENNHETVAVGDTITFTVTSTIPGFADNYTNPVFKLSDKMSAGLSYKGDVQVTVPAGLTKGTQYTVDENKDSNGGYDYVLSFSKDYLYTINAATPITVTYTAEVTSAAIQSVNPEDNTITLNYSTSPDDTTGHGVKRDKTNHYSFDIDANLFGEENYEATEVVKVGVDQNGNEITETRQLANEHWVGALEGAKFKLYKDNAGAKGAAYTNKYYTADTVFVSDANGTLKEQNSSIEGIRGLDAGKYWLDEIEAPAGYIKLQNPVAIEIIAEVDNQTYTETVDGVEVTYYANDLKSYSVKIGGVETANYTMQNKDDGTHAHIKTNKGDTIVGGTDSEEGKPSEDKKGKLQNTQGVELPSTGGIGTTIFYILGGLLVIGAAVILVARRKAQD